MGRLMSQTQIIVLLVAGYAALVTLVRLMLARRNRLVKDLQAEAEAQARRKKAEQDNAPRAPRKAG